MPLKPWVYDLGNFTVFTVKREICEICESGVNTDRDRVLRRFSKGLL